MRGIFKDENTLKSCKIAQMLLSQPSHISFHTPGHKTAGWDITELAYSDNLSSPIGCIAAAERDIAEILGAVKSFILTDGSTSGVLSMLYAAKSLGVKRILTCEQSHKSVYNGAAALGLELLTYPMEYIGKIPNPPTMYALKCDYPDLLEQADAIFLTSPDYYGNVADLAAIKAYCNQTGKPLLIDGAHGGHLHYNKKVYAGAYADMWVDGVHKSLPALTQGAVVSARTEKLAQALQAGVDIFRTTSPSYPIMASVEYAVKYPRNTALEILSQELTKGERFYQNQDWTKVCAVFGDKAREVEKALEDEGIYAEFCDGNVLTFYLSPATEMADFLRLKSALEKWLAAVPLSEEMTPQSQVKSREKIDGAEIEWIALDDAAGRICARNCGMFPPCTPVLFGGEEIINEKIALLKGARHTFGLKNGQIAVLKRAKKE